MTDATLQIEDDGARAASVRDTASDFLALLKPRVMSLVVFTALAGMVLAPGHIHPFMGFISILAIAVGAGASGALNMWYDADIDGRMGRTATRPVPAGRVSPGEALGYGLTLSLFSVLVLAFSANYLAAGLLAFTIFFYAVIYTMWLKRATPQNIVIGGAAGAFPPVIGWAAVTGTVPLESIVLFGIIFMWTPPHFWALSLFKCAEYANVGVPMMPVVHGPRETRRQILIYTLVMVPVTLLPTVMGFASPVYGVVAALLGAQFIRLAVRLWAVGDDDPKHIAAKKLFGFSILYLFALFAVLLGEGIVARAGLV